MKAAVEGVQQLQENQETLWNCHSQKRWRVNRGIPVFCKLQLRQEKEVVSNSKQYRAEKPSQLHQVSTLLVQVAPLVKEKKKHRNGRSLSN